jgi:hypothetical protein
MDFSVFFAFQFEICGGEKLSKNRLVEKCLLSAAIQFLCPVVDNCKDRKSIFIIKADL